MPDFSFEVKLVNDHVAALSIKGFLDANTFEDFDEALNRIFGDSVYKVAIDFSGLEYVSSAGAGVLIAALSIAREHGGEIVIAGAKGEVKEVFDLLGITRLFKIVGDIDRALRRLGAGDQEAGPAAAVAP